MTDRGDRGVVVGRREHIVTVELARPERRNALDLDTLTRLHEVLSAAVAGPDRVVVLLGRGPSFCAGFDLRTEDATSGEGAVRRFAILLQDTTRLLRSPDICSIAGVHGHAIGAGWELAAATDQIVAATGTQFSLPEVGLGLAVGGGITSALTAAAGELRAKDIAIFGRSISAELALQLGLVSEVVPLDQLTDQVGVVIDAALSLPSAALHHAKRLFAHVGPSENLMQAEAEAMARTAMNHRQGQET